MNSPTRPSGDRQPGPPCRRCGHTVLLHYTEALALILCATCGYCYTDLAAECEIAALPDYD